MLLQIIFFSLIGGLLSLLVSIVLLRKTPLRKRSVLTMTSFAAGVLLSVSFLDLLPEAIEVSSEMAVDPRVVFQSSLIAMVAFFLFERSFVWFHHHHEPHHDQPNPLVPMVWIGDTLHNAIDGIVIAASFLVSVPLGIATTLAVAAHEIPQELADLSLYINRGIGISKTLMLNALSSLATVLAAVLAYRFWNILAPWQPQLLAFTSGMFIYIAGSDLIPELHEEYHRRRAWTQVLAFCLGIAAIFLATSLLHV